MTSQSVKHLKEGMRLVNEGAYEAALDYFVQALQMGLDNDMSIMVLHQMAICCLNTEEYCRAEGILNQCLEAGSGLETYELLLAVHTKSGNDERACEICKKIIELLPDDTDIRIKLIDFYVKQSKYIQALSECEVLIEKGHEDKLYIRMFNIYASLLDIKKAFVYMNRYLNEKPDGYYLKNLMIALADSLYDEIYKDNEYIDKINEFKDLTNIPETRQFQYEGDFLKTLRVGLISGNFYKHPVGLFVCSLFTSLSDKKNAEYFCYNTNVGQTDDFITDAIKRSAASYKDIGEADKDGRFDIIFDDKLDILIDLNGFTTGNNLTLMAQRPAPVQMTWIGFPGTTAIKAIDYIIADHLTDPEGMTEKFYTETLIRMSKTFLCYPVVNNYDLTDPPCVTNGYVTFGSFSNGRKFSDKTLRMWAGVLDALPDARLIIHSNSLNNPDTIIYFTHRLENNGIDTTRVKLGSFLNMDDYYRLYNTVDIILDTYPFNGATTTCDAFSMGVPVVSMFGDRHAARVGLSMLTNVGLGWLAAPDEQGFIEAALGLAGDTGRLISLKNNLRREFRSSPLMDTEGFKKEFEERIREAYIKKAGRNLIKVMIDNDKQEEAYNSYQYYIKRCEATIDDYYELFKICENAGRLMEGYSYLEKSFCLMDYNENHPMYLRSRINLFGTSIYNELYQDDEYIRYMNEISRIIKPEPMAVTTEPGLFKRLRIGFISYDLHSHPVGYFIMALFKDKIYGNDIRYYCYYTQDKEGTDPITEKIRENCYSFKRVASYDDKKLMQVILDDKIDVLFDLNSISFGARLFVSASRLAPVQISWIGFAATSCLKNMDYTIVDHMTDPPGAERFYTERLIYMSKTFLCYPLGTDYKVDDSPFIKNGYITFGAFCNYRKITDITIEMWAEVLKRVPGSRLVLRSWTHDETFRLKSFLERFIKLGLDTKRIIFRNFDVYEEYMTGYNEVDIILDTYPFNGATTTCDALSMSVPVINLCGKRHVSRVGLSMLSQVGLSELVAYSKEEYFEKSVSLANNPSKLVYLRRNLRDIMRRSSLADAKAFKLELENRLRGMFIRYCIENGYKASNAGKSVGELYEEILRGAVFLINMADDDEAAEHKEVVLNEFYGLLENYAVHLSEFGSPEIVHYYTETMKTAIKKRKTEHLFVHFCLNPDNGETDIDNLYYYIKSGMAFIRQYNGDEDIIIIERLAAGFLKYSSLIADILEDQYKDDINALIYVSKYRRIIGLYSKAAKINDLFELNRLSEDVLLRLL